MRMPAWVEQMIAELPEKFTGNIQINCFEGGVGNVTYQVSKKEPREVATNGK